MRLIWIYILFVAAGTVFLFLAFQNYVELIESPTEVRPEVFWQKIKWNLITAAACIIPAEIVRRIVLFRRFRGRKSSF